MFDHIVVMGAGAIGSLYAAKLASHHDVTIVARPDHVAAVERGGLHVIGRETFTARVRGARTVPRLVPRTLVLLTTKVNGNRQAAVDLADNLASDTIVLCVQNGLHGEAIVKSVVGSRTVVLRAITNCGAVFREPGVVDFKVAGPTLIEAAPPAAAIADVLTRCGLDGRVSADIAMEVWRKLVFNCVINPITSIIGSEVGAIADERLNPIKQLVIDECVRVARTEGMTCDVGFIAALAETFGPSHNTASMRQDLLKGKPTEIDHMNGAVVALGERHGIACPVNAALVAIIKAMEEQGLGIRG